MVRNMKDVLLEAKAELELQRASEIKTDKFIFPLTYGKLYTIVGMSNTGKSWWSAATAISLARQGFKVGLLSTEDSRIDLWEILENSGILEEEEALANLKWDFLIDASVEDFQNVLEEFAVGCNVLVLDYLRPDIWSNHKGDLNLTMNTLLKVEREFLEKHDSSITIIQTIQANASLYEADFDKKAAENASQLYTKIDGGYTTYKRSHGLAFIRSKSLGMGNYEYSLFVGKVKGQAYQYMKETNIIYEINGEFDITYNKKAKPLIKQQQSLFNKGDK